MNILYNQVAGTNYVECVKNVREYKQNKRKK